LINDFGIFARQSMPNEAIGTNIYLLNAIMPEKRSGLLSEQLREALVKLQQQFITKTPIFDSALLVKFLANGVEH
jgi:hypothetical protein